MESDTKPLQKQDVQAVLRQYQGNLYFQETLEKSTPEDLAQIVIKYIHFNRLFGAGVAHLASQLAFQTSLFKDPTEPSELWADRSMEVASCVFAAAIDEFGDRELSTHPTHRMMAQAVIKGIVESTGYKLEGTDLSYIDAKIEPRVRSGYGVAASLDENKLFRSVGFHIGSELLADEEFRILDTTLRRKYPALVANLEDTVVTISGDKVPAYHWIRVHTHVEIDHFAHAVRAANIALQYYHGAQKKADIKKQMIRGVEEFATVQQEFMGYLCPTKQTS